MTTDDPPPDTIPGYIYGNQAARSPLTVDDLDQLKAAVGLTPDDDAYLAMAADVLGPRADEMVSAWRPHIGAHPHLAILSAYPDGTLNPGYAAASKPLQPVDHRRLHPPARPGLARLPTRGRPPPHQRQEERQRPRRFRRAHPSPLPPRPHRRGHHTMSIPRFDGHTD